MDRRSWIGVLIGGIVAAIAIDVIVLPLRIFMIGIVAQAAARRQPLPFSAAQLGIVVVLLKLLAGTFSGVLGGYVAASIARRNERLVGALSAYFCIGSAVLGFAVPNPAVGPVWLDLFGALLAPLPGILGGYLGFVQRRLTSKRAVVR